MIVTLNDVLHLAALNGAAVLSGQRYLWRKITSVRVLRVADGVDHEEGFDKNELAVTSFDGVWEDPIRQHQFIREIARNGIVGLILFSSVPGRKAIRADVIEVAETLSLPILCLPGKNDPMLCGEIVGSVDKLLRDVESENSLSVAMLECMSQSPRWEQSIQSAVKMLADWMAASIILTDINRNVIAYADYGDANSLTVFRQLKTLPAQENGEPLFLDGAYIYYAELRQPEGTNYQLYALRAVRMERQEMRALVNAMHFAIRLWGQQISCTTTELVKSMLQDEPLKKCRLASLFHINVTDMDALWILHCEHKDELSLNYKLDAIRHLGIMKRTLTLTDVFESSIIIFLETPKVLEQVHLLQQDILQVAEEEDVLFCIGNLPNTAEVRNVYSMYVKYVSDAKKIYPKCRIMSDAHLNMANRCRELMLISPNYSDIMLSPVYRANGKTKPQEMVKFLAAYLLDADMDLNVLAESLYLHRNTVKYRVNALSDVFGFALGTFPSTYDLMLVSGVQRLKGN